MEQLTAPVKGFKVFNPDWACRDKQYTCPGEFKEDVKPMTCSAGMHFCPDLKDCFEYYQNNPNNHCAEVIALGEVVQDGNKCATNHLQIIHEIPWDEVLKRVNQGKGCTGICNTGDLNTGNWNTGDRNTGDWNTACHLLNQIQFMPNVWVWDGYMTVEEKEAHPEYKTTGGFLKVLDTSDCCVRWWKNLDEYQRRIIRSIPNFDAAIFKQITGIDA